MEVRISTNQREWEEAMQTIQYEHASFLQSWAWGDFQEKYGRTVYRFIITHDEVPVLAAQCIIMPLPYGKSYVFMPWGPVMDKEADIRSVFSALLSSPEMDDIVAMHDCLFARFEPLRSDEIDRLHIRKYFKQIKDVEPATTLQLDLLSPEEELLAQMKQKTRYNIRLSNKKGVEVAFYDSVEEIREKKVAQEFEKILEETSSRHGIRNHPIQYYHDMVSELVSAGKFEIGVASYESEIVAIALFVKNENVYTYLHGASTHAHKKVMASHALQWAAIQHAKAGGYKTYDFFGIAPVDGSSPKSQHPLMGVTRFKKGFGGTAVEFPGTFDLPFSRFWYTLYTLRKKIRR